MKYNVPNCSLFARVEGEGEPLIFIHGFPLNHRMWEPQIQFLSSSGFKVIAPDLRGFGDSLVDIQEWTMDDFANDIICLADNLGIQNFVVAGMSMGGYITFNLLERFGDRISKAILIATKAQADDEAAKNRRNELIQAAKTSGKTPVIEAFKKILFAPITWERNIRLVEKVSILMERASLNGIIGSLGAMRDRKDYVDFLEKIEIPVLIIHGKSDLASPLQNAELMVSKIKNAQFYFSDVAGHMVNLEDADNVNQAILQFLKN
ncbi:MAG: alpha/beta hydrolase [Ignavibacteria bacterium]|jgi:pimeloyl-ACP methyl ester carboxylesterase|nr:alpha/beta hydrolase [Ignavibacteria bacterium]MDH7528594.1 alpha/beta hydrolase [Ignavibacteria bacterium]